jgi:glucose/arabinose dehydrogenase
MPRRSLAIGLACLPFVACSGTHSAPDAGPKPKPGPDTPFCQLGKDVLGATVPDGFCIKLFAIVKTPRVIAFAPNGDVFVSSPSAPTPGGAPTGMAGVYVLPDDDGDGIADSTNAFMSGGDLGTVHGLAFSSNQLIYTVESAVYSLPYTVGDRSSQGKTPTMIADLSNHGPVDRWTHGVGIAQDGSIYVSRGQLDNKTCPSPNASSGSVLRIGAGHAMQGDVVIQGCRNPMYMRCAPWGSCYVAELSGDDWVGIGGTEKLIELKDGDNYGYPCCIDTNIPRPDINPPPDCSAVAAKVQAYTLHDTPFGFDWETAKKWPAPYTGGFFIGFHGSFFDAWRGTRLGFTQVDATTHHPTGNVQNFVTGWGQGQPIVGRIADVRFAPDGRLFFTDDEGGGVYWVAPKDLKPTKTSTTH